MAEHLRSSRHMCKYGVPVPFVGRDCRQQPAASRYQGNKARIQWQVAEMAGALTPQLLCLWYRQAPANDAPPSRLPAIARNRLHQHSFISGQSIHTLGSDSAVLRHHRVASEICRRSVSSRYSRPGRFFSAFSPAPRPTTRNLFFPTCKLALGYPLCRVSLFGVSSATHLPRNRWPSGFNACETEH